MSFWYIFWIIVGVRPTVLCTLLKTNREKEKKRERKCNKVCVCWWGLARLLDHEQGFGVEWENWSLVSCTSVGML